MAKPLAEIRRQQLNVAHDRFTIILNTPTFAAAARAVSLSSTGIRSVYHKACRESRRFLPESHPLRHHEIPYPIALAKEHATALLIAHTKWMESPHYWEKYKTVIIPEFKPRKHEIAGFDLGGWRDRLTGNVKVEGSDRILDNWPEQIPFMGEVYTLEHVELGTERGNLSWENAIYA